MTIQYQFIELNHGVFVRKDQIVRFRAHENGSILVEVLPVISDGDLWLCNVKDRTLSNFLDALKSEDVVVCLPTKDMP